MRPHAKSRKQRPILGVMQRHLYGYLDQKILQSLTPAAQPAEGCGPAFWRMPRNLYAWFATGYAPFQSLESIFDVPDEYRLDNVPLWLALLNAAHSGVDYPLTEAEVISEVNAALASGDRMTMLRLAQELTRYNNGFCPLRKGR